MVGDKFINKNFIIIYSYDELVEGNSAASARMMNYARAISTKMCVLLLSYNRPLSIQKKLMVEIEKRIYTVGVEDLNTDKKVSIFNFLFSINSLINELKNGKIPTLLLYPTTKTYFDIISWFYFKKIRRLKLFCEINEVRKYSSNLIYRNNKKIKDILIKKWLIYKYKLFDRTTMYFDGLVCISTNIEKYFSNYNNNIIRVPILTDLKINKNISKIIDIENNFKVGFFGSVNYHKENFELLFRSLYVFKNEYKIGDFKMDFYGPLDKNSLSQMERDIDKYNLENNVHYKDKVTQDGIIDYMQKYDLLILPRGNNLQNKYGFSTKLSEYLISGIPILITDVSDNSLYIKDNINGFIVPPDDYIVFAKKMKFIYDNYNEYFPKINENSIKTVRKNFSYHNYCDELIDFLC